MKDKEYFDLQTPCYIYNKQKIIENVSKLKAACKGTEIYYSMKANPHPEIVKIAAGCADGVEICSEGEYEIALLAGVAASQMIYVGPYKPYAALKRVIEDKIGMLVCESKSELEQISRISAEKGVNTGIALRVNLGAEGMTVKSSNPISIMDGNQFGLDETQFMKILQNPLPNISIKGIQSYGFTNITAADSIIERIKRLSVLAIRMNAIMPVSFLDFGGGFGIPYLVEKSEELDMRMLSDGVSEILSNLRRTLPECRFVFESGRYIVGNAGEFAAAVRVKKTVNHKGFFILDGGSNSFSCPDSFMGARQPFYRIINKGMDRPSDNGLIYDVCGPLCTPSDRMIKGLGNHAEEGDIFVFQNAGAYGYSAAPGLFLSFGYPCQYLKDGKDLIILE